MRSNKIRIVKSVLGKEIGRTWPLFLLKCFIGKNVPFKNSHWSKMKGAEAEFVKPLSLLAAAYTELQKKYGGEKALEIMKKLIIPLGCDETTALLKSLHMPPGKPLDLLIAYLGLVDTRGAGRFCKSEMKYDKNVCRRIVERCLFHDFFSQTGMPELTGFFCQVDREFYTKAFPELRFHRNGSWENTIAYGKDHCEFVFENKKPPLGFIKVKPPLTTTKGGGFFLSKREIKKHDSLAPYPQKTKKLTR
jgi:hypothetical protein